MKRQHHREEATSGGSHAPFTYAAQAVPDDYRCGVCGAHGVKLWREYQTFGVYLECVTCACKSQGKPDNVDDHGYRTAETGGQTDTIGWRVPAVPAEDGGYWGYSSVPAEGVTWWHRLPTRKP